jgi:hypothetical protein
VSEIPKSDVEIEVTSEPQEARAVDSPSRATRRETINRLNAVSDGPFFEMLLEELTDRLNWQFAAGGKTEKIEGLMDLAMAMDDPEVIQEMLYAVRTAMEAIVRGGSAADQELAAAAGLHYLGFRQLVQRSNIAPAHGENLLQMMRIDAAQNPAHQSPELIIGAIVVSAVFGGTVEFDAGGLTRNPSHMRRIVKPEGADWTENAVDRALFAAWFHTDARAPHIADGTVDMTTGEKDRLQARISELRVRKRFAAGVWVSSGEQHQALFSSIGKRFKIPILLETSVAVRAALGMSPGALLAQMGEYWKLDTELRQSLVSALVPVTSQSTNPSTQGDKTMSANNINFGDNAVVTLAIDGSNMSTSQQVAHNGLDAAALTPLLQTLAAAIAALDDSHAKKAGYEADLQVLVDQSKAAKPDKLRMANALENLKKAPEYLKGGEAIVTAGKAIVDAATTLYHSVASFLTSNPVLTA